MKKYVLPLLALLPFFALGQNVKGPYLGATTQLQNTWIINDEQYEGVNYRHNFTTQWAPFGFVAGYKFNENHNVQVELIRSKQGEKFDLVDRNGNKTGEKDIDLVYWNLPLLFKYTTAGTTRFNFHFGPQVSFLQKGREENRFSNTAEYELKDRTFTIPAGTYLLASTQDKDQQQTGMGKFNQYDLGVLIGLGIELDVSRNAYLSANIRYAYNFVNIRKEEDITSAYDPDRYTLRQNMVVGAQVGIHYLFNTGDGNTPARHQ